MIWHELGIMPKKLSILNLGQESLTFRMRRPCGRSALHLIITGQIWGCAQVFLRRVVGQQCLERQHIPVARRKLTT